MSVIIHELLWFEVFFIIPYIKLIEWNTYSDGKYNIDDRYREDISSDI